MKRGVLLEISSGGARHEGNTDSFVRVLYSAVDLSPFVMLVAIHAKTYDVLIALEKGFEAETPSVITVVEHGRDMAYHEYLPVLAF